MDFTYEVSRALAACEGAVLVVDASQGIEAQTLANVYMALDHDLEIIPVINKIDLPSAQPDVVRHEIEDEIGLDTEGCPLVSAKQGIGIEDVLEAIVQKRARAHGRRGRALAGADLRFLLRQLPRRHFLRARQGGQRQGGRPHPHDGGRARV